VLGFEPDAFYAPTRWQSYKCQGTVFFAVGEEPGSTNEIAFAVPDVNALWERVKDRVDVVSPLETTPWGTFRFVIRDPDVIFSPFLRSSNGSHCHQDSVETSRNRPIRASQSKAADYESEGIYPHVKANCITNSSLPEPSRLKVRRMKSGRSKYAGP